VKLAWYGSISLSAFIILVSFVYLLAALDAFYASSSFFDYEEDDDYDDKICM